ncbi:MAG: hypothetical protein AAGC57_19520 [Pseudomonadota bacterium]
MSDPMPAPAELATLPEGRNVVSFRLGVEPSGRVVLFKLKTADGRSEALLLATPIAVHVRDRIAQTLRARPGLAEVPQDDVFFAAQPTIMPDDWAPLSPHVGEAQGAHVETAGTTCVLAFPMDASGRYTACRMTALQAAYFLHAINAAEESGDLKSPEAGASEETKTVH